MYGKTTQCCEGMKEIRNLNHESILYFALPQALGSSASLRVYQKWKLLGFNVFGQ